MRQKDLYPRRQFDFFVFNLSSKTYSHVFHPNNPLMYWTSFFSYYYHSAFSFPNLYQGIHLRKPRFYTVKYHVELFIIIYLTFLGDPVYAVSTRIAYSKPSNHIKNSIMVKHKKQKLIFRCENLLSYPSTEIVYILYFPDVYFKNNFTRNSAVDI